MEEKQEKKVSVQNPERSQSRPGRGKCRSGEVHQKCALKTEHEIYFHRKKKKKSQYKCRDYSLVFAENLEGLMGGSHQGEL